MPVAKFTAPAVPVISRFSRADLSETAFLPNSKLTLMQNDPASATSVIVKLRQVQSQPLLFVDEQLQSESAVDSGSGICVWPEHPLRHPQRYSFFGTAWWIDRCRLSVVRVDVVVVVHFV